MQKQSREQKGIYCQDDQHFHRGQKIKYLMVKKDKGSITKRLFCDECYLGKYSGQQQYCCDLSEVSNFLLNQLINGNIYEAFKYTMFDSDQKNQYFNYIRNHQPYLDEEYIKNVKYFQMQMVGSLKEEFLSILEDLEEQLLKDCASYKEEIRKWADNGSINNYFDCQVLRDKILDPEFERSPKKFDELNTSAEKYVENINSNEDKLKIEIDKIISNQKKFFNLDRFNLSFKETIQQLTNMQQRTFSDYKFSQSILATPYIEKIIEKINQGTVEDVMKNLKLIYRKTQYGSNFQNLQKFPQLYDSDTITIIQTKNKCIFGVYSCVSLPEKSILFQMNKEQYFQLKDKKNALTINPKADNSTWIMKFGDDDVIIQSTFSRCTSNLGKGFNIDGKEIFDKEEYLSDSKLFEIYDMEIFEVGKVYNNEKPIPKMPQFQPSTNNINNNLPNPPFPTLNHQNPPISNPVRSTLQYPNQSPNQNINLIRQTFIPQTNDIQQLNKK